MISIFAIIRKIIQVMVPSIIKRSGLFLALKGVFYRHLISHDAIYDSRYYATDVEGPAASSAPDISHSITSDLQPHTVVDVGCGTGALLEVLKENGCQVFGLEYSEAALKFCRDRGVDVQKFDLENEALANDQTFDVAVSMEVGEHLPEKSADRYVEILAKLSDTIVFSAARPGPPERHAHDHVNEQPKPYWLSKFRIFGFEYDEIMSDQWRKKWQAGGTVVWWYHENVMILRRLAEPECELPVGQPSC